MELPRWTRAPTRQRQPRYWPPVCWPPHCLPGAPQGWTRRRRCGTDYPVRELTIFSESCYYLIGEHSGQGYSPKESPEILKTAEVLACCPLVFPLIGTVIESVPKSIRAMPLTSTEPLARRRCAGPQYSGDYFAFCS